ncbi:hypothetical protein BH10PSE1_BH10PSE1_02290 [soil metagenome]
MRRYLVSVCLIAGFAATLAACGPKAEPAVPVAPAAVAPAPPALPAGVSVTSPVMDAIVGSPLVVTGFAPSDWYFEAQFDAQLLAADGTVLAEAPARAQGDDWMSKASVPFTASLSYVSATAQAGTVVLTEDQTGEDLPPPRTVRIPVMLSAAS